MDKNNDNDDQNYDNIITWQGEQAAQHWGWWVPAWPPASQPSPSRASRSSGPRLPVGSKSISSDRSTLRYHVPLQVWGPHFLLFHNSHSKPQLCINATKRNSHKSTQSMHSCNWSERTHVPRRLRSTSKLYLILKRSPLKALIGGRLGSCVHFVLTNWSRQFARVQDRRSRWST